MDFVNACSHAGVISIINDRADIAILASADGVHLGQDDLPIDKVRAIQQKPMIIGVSTHNTEQLEAAIKTNPSYVALGPVFTTPTKPDIEIAGTEYLRKAVALLGDSGINHVTIGGITGANINEVLNIGAKTVAVCSSVCSADDVSKACSVLKEAIVNHP